MLKQKVAAGPAYQIRFYRTGRCRIAGRYAYKHLFQDRDHSFFLYISVISRPGFTALVDVGMQDVAEMNRGAGFLMTELIHQEPDEDLLSILNQAERTPQEIDMILLTHCHYDHCSNLDVFPRARVVIPRQAWLDWHTDPQTAVYLHEGLLSELEALEQQGRLILEDEGLVTPGIGVRRMGGHSRCSQFIYANTSQGVAVFSGDTVQMFGNLEQDDIISICEDEAECWRALEIARAEADLLIPGHDPLVLERYPGGLPAGASG